MTIRDLYVKLGNVSLNVSLFFLLLCVGLTAVLIYQGQSLIISLFLPIISIVYYLLHLFYLSKSNKVYPYLTSNRENGIVNTYLIEQVNQKLYFFSPDGNAKYQVNPTAKFWGFIDLKEETSVQKVELVKKGNLMINHSMENSTGYIDLSNRTMSKIMTSDGCEIRAIKKSTSHYIFMKNQKVVAEIKKGWMPLRLTTLFRLNTPVLSFQELLTDEEKTYIMLTSVSFLSR